MRRADVYTRNAGKTRTDGDEKYILVFKKKFTYLLRTSVWKHYGTKTKCFLANLRFTEFIKKKK